MNKGIIYVMTTAVPGLIKIGKTGSLNFEQRMYNLEHDGYRNVTALKRAFAIEVEDYNDKESMLHTIFEKSRLSDTELFALDVNIAIQLLSSFDGTVVYPKTETKGEIFDEATDNGKGKIIPNGKYTFKRKKKSDSKTIIARAIVSNGSWTILKGSVLGIHEDVGGIPQKAIPIRATMAIDSNGTLLEDTELGECSPSFAGSIVMNAPCDGWMYWFNSEGKPIDIYRVRKTDD